MSTEEWPWRKDVDGEKAEDREEPHSQPDKDWPERLQENQEKGKGKESFRKRHWSNIKYYRSSERSISLSWFIIPAEFTAVLCV